MNAKAKTINLLLYDGSLSGVISIEDSNWNAGELYSAPRSSVQDLLKTDACNKYGVYLLLSSNMVYVGQSSDLAKRITQHTIGKDWWQSVVILTTKDDNLTRSDIDYLEYVLIEKAFAVNKLDCDNKKKGNPPKVDKFRRLILDQYLEEAMFLLQLIGISVFAVQKEKAEKPKATTTVPTIHTVDIKTTLSLGRRAKKEAVSFLSEHGIQMGKTVSYAVRQQKRDEYWANPNQNVLLDDWFIVLNDNKSMELTVLLVPANSIHLHDENTTGLYARKDRPKMLDLNLSVLSLKDHRSGIDFSKYVLQKMKY